MRLILTRRSIQLTVLAIKIDLDDNNYVVTLTGLLKLILGTTKSYAAERYATRICDDIELFILRNELRSVMKV